MFVPDNFEMWHLFDNEQERQLEGLPVCADCDEPIQTETAYYFHGDWICESCIESYRRDVQPL